MKKIDIVALIFLLAGGINWGLWGLFEFNLIYYIFGENWIYRVLFVLFGISAVYIAAVWNDFGIRWVTRNKSKSPRS